MKVVDLHCDTMSELWHAENERRKADFRADYLHVNLDKLKKGDYLLQTFATYVNLGWKEDPLIAGMEEIDIFKRVMKTYGKDIMQVYNYNDIEEAQRHGKIAALLSIEEGEVCKGSLGVLRRMYELGVRMMTLTWNYENQLAYPNTVPQDMEKVFPCKANTNKGLKARGFEFIQEMENLGIIIDVSHLSDAGFFDVANHTKKPFIASHSNARSMCSHVRNLTDEMLEIIGNRGGIIGLNYCASFLQEPDKNGNCISRIEDMARHAKYMINKAGSDALSLGSDFDGISGDLELADASYMQQLAEGLKKAGIKEEQVEKIFYKNALNFFKENL